MKYVPARFSLNSSDSSRYLTERDFCDLFQPRVTLSYDLLVTKVDCYVDQLRQFGIKIDSFIFKISCSQLWQQR